MRVAVVGAGIAGAIAARTLVDAGHTVVVFDKARGPSGRMATRRVNVSQMALTFDHGAQYVTAGDPRFLHFLNAAVRAGVAEPWDAGPVPGAAVGTPRMSALVRHALGDITTRYAFTVQRLSPQPAGGWQLTSAEGADAGPFEAVILTVPAPQLYPLISSLEPRFADAAGAARYRPTWALMLAFSEDLRPRLAELGHDAMAGEGVEWLVFDGGKPSRQGATVVCHADRAWSEANLERDRDAVVSDMTARVCTVLTLPQPLYAAAHRWRYSRVVDVGAVEAPYNAQLGLGVAGDWCAGDTVEAAFLSGLACAEAANERRTLD